MQNWEFWFNGCSGYATDEPNCVMSVNPSWEYIMSDVRLYLGKIQDLRNAGMDHAIEQCIIHELMHCLVNPMCVHEADSRLEEFTVSSLVSAIVNFRRNLWENMKEGETNA